MICFRWFIWLFGLILLFSCCTISWWFFVTVVLPLSNFISTGRLRVFYCQSPKILSIILRLIGGVALVTTNLDMKNFSNERLMVYMPIFSKIKTIDYPRNWVSCHQEKFSWPQVDCIWSKKWKFGVFLARNHKDLLNFAIFDSSSPCPIFIMRNHWDHHRVV